MDILAQKPYNKTIIKIKDVDENIAESEGYKGQKEKLFKVLKYYLKSIDENREVALITFKIHKTLKPYNLL